MGKRSRSRRETSAVTRIASDPQEIAVEAQTSESHRRPDILISFALVAAVFAVYGSVVTHAFIVLDDLDYIVENPHVASGLTLANVIWAWRAFYAGYWIPITWMSHMLDVQLFGLDAGKHLLVNVTLHAATTVLLFSFLARATNRRWPSAAVAALFALHPLHVESVAWATERKDVLSAFFFAVALLFYLRFVRTRLPGQYLTTLAAFALGLAAKPMLVTFPFVLLLLDWWPLRRPLRANLILEKLPFFALSIVSSLLTMHTQQVAMVASPLSYRLQNAILSYVTYLGKTIWPLNLAVIYPFRSQIAPAAIAGAVVFLAGITAICAAAARRCPYLIVGWLWFLGTLVPVIGVVQVGLQSMADRFTYIPLIGIFIAVSWLITDVVTNRKAVAFLSSIVLVCLAVLASLQVRVWRGDVSLFSHAIAAVPANGLAHTYLAVALQRTDRSASIDHFQQALKINPIDDVARVGLANSLNAIGDNVAATEEARLAVKINPRNPAAFKTLGILELRAGHKEEALRLFERSLALKYDPHAAAEAAVAAGNGNEAIAKYEEALQFREEALQFRNDSDLHNNLGALFAESGRNDEALREYRAALRLDPAYYDALMNLGALLSRMGNDAEAANEFSAAARIRPRSSEPHIYLALIAAQTGRFRAAISEVDAAMAADPVAANQQLSSAIRIPFKETNLQDYRAFLTGKTEGK